MHSDHRHQLSQTHTCCHIQQDLVCAPAFLTLIQHRPILSHLTYIWYIFGNNTKHSIVVSLSKWTAAGQTSIKALLGDGIAVGKQIIGTTFNTLFFGFFGGFLALFIWFTGVHYSVGEILNDKIFVSEILMILFAMVSVILTVPITTWVMTRAVAGQRKRAAKDTSK